MKTLAALLLLITTVQCAKILGIFPMCARSHYILGSSLMIGLAERGHDVTVISCFGEKTPPKNRTYRDIVTAQAKKEMDEKRNNNINLFEMNSMNPFVKSAYVVFELSKWMILPLADPKVQELFKSDEKFDVVIMEQFLNDAHKAVAAYYNAPLIMLSTVGANFWVNSLVGNPSSPSYIPYINLDISHPMTFCDRLVNSLVYAFNGFLYDFFVFPHQNQVAKTYISPDINLYDSLYNVSIFLMNSHPSINQPVPYVPNMIDIGGYHIKPPKPLPSDLQKFLDEAKEGVIYFSMGSNLKSADLPLEKREAILKTFSKLKVKVLWKWEDDTLPGQPSNVKLGKWLPQQDILAHLNVKLFITHGGYLSTSETIYHGVPVLAIPIFADQHLNARVAVKNGYGLILELAELNEERLTESLNELLNNPKYSSTAKYRSKLFHDRPVKPMDTAAYWVDYVARHRGAPHLRVGALDLPWYKYHLLDVIAFVTLVAITFLFVLYKVGKFVCKKYCSTKNKKVKKN